MMTDIFILILMYIIVIINICNIIYLPEVSDPYDDYYFTFRSKEIILTLHDTVKSEIVCVCVCACMCVRACMCVCVWMHACVLITLFVYECVCDQNEHPGQLDSL